MPGSKSFAFHTELHLVALTGVRALGVSGLRAALQTLPGSSIFYHTHQQYLTHNFEQPIYYNEFALWAHETLREEALAEKLAAIDLLAFTSIRELRAALIATIDDHIPNIWRPGFECRPDDAFHFCKSKSFILPTGIMARDLPDFFATLPQVSNASLYFHFFEARLRLRRRTNAFSRWIKDCGRPDLAEAVEKLDPYIRTLDELREAIIAVGDEMRKPT